MRLTSLIYILALILGVSFLIPAILVWGNSWYFLGIGSIMIIGAILGLIFFRK